MHLDILLLQFFFIIYKHHVRRSWYLTLKKPFQASYYSNEKYTVSIQIRTTQTWNSITHQNRTNIDTKIVWNLNCHYLKLEYESHLEFSTHTHNFKFLISEKQIKRIIKFCNTKPINMYFKQKQIPNKKWMLNLKNIFFDLAGQN